MKVITLNLTLYNNRSKYRRCRYRYDRTPRIPSAVAAVTFTLSVLDNHIDGGAGTDEVSYAGSAAGVTVNLSLTTRKNTVAAALIRF